MVNRTVTHTIIDQQTSELAFKVYAFKDLDHFDHLQRRNYYSLILMQKGEPTLKVGLSEYILSEGAMICLSPYQPFMITSDVECTGWMLNFHPDFFCTYRHQNEIETEGVLFHNFHQAPYFRLSEESIFLNLFHQISLELTKNKIAQHEVLVAYLKIFLIEAVRQKRNFENDNEPDPTADRTEMIQKLLDAIENNFCAVNTPQKYADILCVSAKTLGRITKKNLGKTLTELISNRVVIEAKRELYLTSKSVKQVSALLGYPDEFYFSRLFKKKVGVSPDVYRKTVGFAKLEIK
jgi:AraC-like DNA-binding protein